MAYFHARGLTVMRVDFLWERLQRAPFAPLHEPDVERLRRVLDAAQAAGQVVLLDMHNYGRYYGRPLTTSDGPLLADGWRRLALAFRDHPAVWGYELMNEPHDLPGHGETWSSLAQAATDAIRIVDQRAWVLVPGYGWQSALGWPENNGSLDVRDPAGRLLYAAHQYFDSDFDSVYGSYEAEGAYPQRAADLIAPFQAWLATRGARGFFTEYGVPADDPRWLRVLDGFLTALERDPRLAGGTYWAAGPWWGQHVRYGELRQETYPLSVEPSGGVDRPQLAVLAAHPTR